MASYATARELALALPDAVERTSYGTPAFFVNKQLFLRFREDGENLVIKVDFDQREILMKAKPAVYFITDHYRDHQLMLVKLSKVSKTALRQLLKDAWELAAE